MSVDGKIAGDTLRLSPGKAKLHVRARARSIEPYEVLEIIVNGSVVAKSTPGGPRSRYDAALDQVIEVKRGGWIAARAHGLMMLPYGATWWQMPVFAHTSPIYLDMPGRPAIAEKSAEILLEQLGYLERWAKEKANFPTAAARDQALDYIAQATKVYEDAKAGSGK
jgi:hypothetical protein